MEPQPREPDRVSAVSDDAPIVVMGVSGSGKSTVGSALAQRLRVPFLDADALHPPANIAKMTAGEPLNDDDRYPWLEKVGEWLAGHRDGGVVACSALKRKYRDQLRAHCPRVEFLHLRGSPEVIGRRLAARSGHFMPPALLQSQFDALEPLGADERGVVINLDEDVQDVGAIVDTFLAESADWHHT
jgi:gluconokinase